MKTFFWHRQNVRELQQLCFEIGSKMFVDSDLLISSINNLIRIANFQDHYTYDLIITNEYTTINLCLSLRSKCEVEQRDENFCVSSRFFSDFKTEI